MPLAMTLRPQPGSWGDVTTLAGWFHHVRRGDYGTFRLFSTDDKHEDVWTRLWLYAVDLSTREVPLHLAAPVLTLGIATTLQPMRGATASTTRRSGATTDPKDASVGWLLLATYTFYMLVFHSLANLPLSEGLTYGVHMRFWQQPNVIVFLWLGVGLSRALELLTQFAVRVSSSSNSVMPSAIAALASVLCLSLVGVQVATWYTLCDQSRAVYIRDYARALLDPLPHDAVLIVNFDLQWTALRYLQRCEHRRTDVTLLNLSMMSFAWFATKHAHYPTLTFPGTRLVPFGGAVRLESPGRSGDLFCSLLVGLTNTASHSLSLAAWISRTASRLRASSTRTTSHLDASAAASSLAASSTTRTPTCSQRTRSRRLDSSMSSIAWMRRRLRQRSSSRSGTRPSSV